MLLTCKQLEKKFGETVILRDVSLSINCGEAVGLIGHNGSGKTVLLKMIAGLLKPDRGCIWICDEKISFGKYSRHLGVLIERPGILLNLSASENLKALASIQRIADASRIRSLLELFELDPSDKRPTKKYSLGMKQKLGIIMAILDRPRLVLLDEPMSNLDKNSIQKIRKILLELIKKEGMSILIATHQKDDIEMLTNKVFEIKENRLVEVDLFDRKSCFR